jgi:hypothetical protein
MLFTVFLLADFYSFLKKIRLYSGFKNTYKKIRETRKLESNCELHLVEGKVEGRKPDKDSSLRISSLCPETLTKNAVQEFPLEG